MDWNFIVLLSFLLVAIFPVLIVIPSLLAALMLPGVSPRNMIHCTALCSVTACLILWTVIIAVWSYLLRLSPFPSLFSICVLSVITIVAVLVTAIILFIGRYMVEVLIYRYIANWRHRNHTLT